VNQPPHHLDTAGHRDGARVVARAWSDPAYRERLLHDASAALRELGIELDGYDQLHVVENTEQVHHVVVCTRCSCTPSPLTGSTPDWYSSAAYRTRVVAAPREVLSERGLDLPPEVEIRVVDTEPSRRCLVLPRRPAGSSGLSEAQLALLVTQESLFGVGQPAGPVGA
jgi:nitrile hydratase